MGTVRKTGVIGAEETYNTISAIDEPSGEILSQDIRTEKPIYGTVEQPINFIKHDVVNLDGTPQNPKIIKYFGINNN